LVFEIFYIFHLYQKLCFTPLLSHSLPSISFLNDSLFVCNIHTHETRVFPCADACLWFKIIKTFLNKFAIWFQYGFRKKYRNKSFKFELRGFVSLFFEFRKCNQKLIARLTHILKRSNMRFELSNTFSKLVLAYSLLSTRPPPIMSLIECKLPLFL